MILYKDFEFDTAHRLSDYKGLCNNIHGHTYRLTIGLSIDKLNKLDIGTDFKDIKKTVNEYIIDAFDHALWLKDDKFNKDIIELMKEKKMKLVVTKFNPTAEMMALWIWDILEEKLPLYTITLYETPTSRVTINKNDYLTMRKALGNEE